MLACGGLLALGVALAWRWRAYAVALRPWAARGDPGVRSALRALVWLLNTALVSGLLLGVLVVAPAGRLAMRLLAAASPWTAQGRLTEAGEVVGEITVSGTVALFVFVGLPFGLLFALVHVFAAFVMPRGVMGGALLGGALLVLLGSTLEPLRPENRDFAILEPAWLSVVTFTAMALLTGAVAAPVAGRVGAALDRPKVWWAVWLLPVGLLLVIALPSSPVWVPLVGALACVAFVAAVAMPTERRTAVRRQGRRVALGALAVALVVTAPGFLSAVSAIVAS